MKKKTTPDSLGDPPLPCSPCATLSSAVVVWPMIALLVLVLVLML